MKNALVIITSKVSDPDREAVLKILGASAAYLGRMLRAEGKLAVEDVREWLEARLGEFNDALTSKYVDEITANMVRSVVNAVCADAPALVSLRCGPARAERMAG